MTIKIGDTVTAYNKPWTINNVNTADEVQKEFPEIGIAMKRLGMRLLLVLEGGTKTIDLGFMRIHGQRNMTTVLVDNAGNFHDPDKVLSKLVQ